MEEKYTRRRRKRRKSVWPKVILIAAVVVAVIVAAVAILEANKKLTIQLQSSTVTLEFGQEYAAPPMTVLLDEEKVDAEITADLPEMTELGEYTVTYTATYGKRVAEAEVKVLVVDTTAPVITLKYDPESVTLPGEQYVEEGYSAYDICDGDLTDRVQRMVVDGVVHYKVTDSSGNVTQVQRKIEYKDMTPPQLELLGDATVVLTVGEEYQEPGFDARDNLDGDLTDAVIIEGNYDTKVAGTYSITYTVTDSSGNTVTRTRTLVVRNASGEINVTDPGEKVIYLTFDDGPSQYTLELLEILEKYDVKATFFVVGTSKVEYLEDIAQGGHAIGIHSNTHDYETIYASDEAFMKDILALRETIYEHTGIYTNLIRFPGGSSNTISIKLCPGIMTRLTETLTDQGYRIFDWNVDSGDASGLKDPDEIAAKVIAGIQTKTRAVVLQHDIRDYSVAAVEQIIAWGLANGYTFLPLDETSPVCQHAVAN